MVAKSLRHKFVSAVADSTDTTLVRSQSNWNDDHNLWLGGRTASGTTDTIADSDHLCLIKYSNAGGIAVTLPQAGASSQFISGWTTFVRNYGVGDVTITPTTSQINQAASLVIGAQQGAIIFSDGSNYDAIITVVKATGAEVAAGTNDTKFVTPLRLAGMGFAPLASPAFTGTPTAPTPTPASDSSTKIATTAFIAATYAPLASPTFSGTPAAPTPTISPSDNSTKLATTAYVVGEVAPNCGRLVYSSSTQIKFVPCAGNKFKNNGQLYDIPSAGIAAGGTGVYRDGVAGQNLVPGGIYYVHIFNNAGTPTIDYCTATTSSHATDTTAGNIGVEIKSGDSTRTLVGLVQYGGGSTFNDTLVARFVASWFNRRIRGLQGTYSSGSTSSGSWTEIASGARVYFLCWSDEEVIASVTGSCTNNTSSTFVYSSLALNTGPVTNTQFQVYAANAIGIIATTFTFAAISETQANYFTLMGQIGGGGTGTWNPFSITGFVEI